MSHALENTNRRARRTRWVMLGAAVVATLSCSGSSDTSPTSGDPVAAVVVNPPSLTIAVGAQQPLQAQVQDAAGNLIADAPVVWSVKDPAIASVSSSGVVTALAPGATQIAANSNGKSGIAAITVNKIPVASVVVRPTHVDAIAGSKTPLTAVAYDAAQNALAGRTINWTSSNQSVATVDANGMITAVAAGSATITGTSEGKSDAATVTVTQGPVVSVVVTPDSVAMFVTQTTQLAATARDATGAPVAGTTIVWSSSNTSVASVSSDGVVTAVSAGSATITATANGHSGTTAVTVTTVPVASVSVSPSTVSLSPGGSTTLSAAAKDANGNVLPNRAVAWSSSNSAVATVSGTGVVTAVALGTATITATSEGKSGTASVTVAPAPVASVTVAPAPSSVIIGQTTQLTATVRDANGSILTGRAVTWTSSNTAIATVSSTGLVTGVALGSATITATSETKSGTSALTVSAVPVGSVTVAPTTATVNDGHTTTLVATVKDANGAVVTDRVVTWSSSNTAAATVSSTGVVTGVAAGTATITATSETKSGSAAITVVALPVGSVTVSPSTASVINGQTTTLTATVKDQTGTVVTSRVVTWSSNNTAVATVSSTGVVTGVSPGAATITATSEGKSGSAAITITVAPVGSVTVSPSTATVIVLGTTTLTAVVKDVNGTVVTNRLVTWSSSSPLVASVSSNGVVSGLVPGTSTITATSEGKSGTSVVTVTLAPVASVTVTPTSVSVPSGSTMQFTATLKDALGNVLTGRTVTWSSGNTATATVSASGLATAVLIGSTAITATSEGVSGSGTITVTSGPVATVQVTPPSATIAVNGTVQLSAKALDAAGNTISGAAFTWSSNSSNAIVSSSGLVTGKKAGPATITATSGTKNGTSSITVSP